MWLPLDSAPLDGEVVDLWSQPENQPAFRAHDARFNTELNVWEWDVTSGTPKQVLNATHWRPLPDKPFDIGSITKRSTWTMVYADIQPGKGMVHYVRLVPSFLELEPLGFPHGLSVGNVTFATKQEAFDFSKRIDQFMNAVARDLLTGSASLAVVSAPAEDA